jgi:tellurite resistance protein TehA-like permease
MMNDMDSMDGMGWMMWGMSAFWLLVLIAVALVKYLRERN